MRGSTEEALTMVRAIIMRGVVETTDDSRRMQEVTVRLLHGQVIRGVERYQTSGHTSVPRPMDQDGKGTEVIVVSPMGDPSQAVVVGTDERRDRPKNMKPGESAMYDDQSQIHKVGRDGIETTGKTVVITGGGENPRTDTVDHELNQLAKGLRAEITQLKDSHHALFDVVSKLRQNAENVVVGLAAINAATQVTSALSGLPAGLDAMKALASDKLQSYFQNAASDALKGFLDPSRMLNVESVLGAGIEAAIAAAKAQLADLIAQNPIVKTVDGLRAELDALTTSGGPQSVIQAGIARLQPQIAALTAANPVLADVAALRSQIDTLIANAGTGLNFLAVQKRAAQGLIRSVKFGG